MSPTVEYINDDTGRNLAIVFHREGPGEVTKQAVFVTPPAAPMQAAFMRLANGHHVKPHYHPPQNREVRHTSETLIVMRGAVAVDVYHENGRLIRNVMLKSGDFVVLYAGGHGVTVLAEDTEVIEVKQGPYDPTRDKQPLQAATPESANYVI
jgi:cupin fold WbuC family metalloprotein